MAEYIKRDDVLGLSYCPTSLTWDNPLAEQKSVVDVDDINSIPTADVVEVRHGEWKVYEEGGYWNYDCPFCDNGFVIKTKITPPNYCENCGAKMDGGKTE